MTTLAVLTQRIKAQPAHSQAPVTAQPWKEAAFQLFFSCSTLLRLSGAFFRPGLALLLLFYVDRFYAENNANIECPIAEAKPNLDVEKVK